MLGIGCKWLDDRPLSVAEAMRLRPLPCSPIPAEMFTETYAACALGVSRWELPRDQWWYSYAPPPGVESALCDLIRGKVGYKPRWKLNRGR